ncbi:MAG: TonB-dependent receptor [Rikenellaceae bacterium]
MKKIQQSKSVACFRRWSRKSYSAFASLKREVTIGVLWVGMSILSLVANGAYAAEVADSLSYGQDIELRDVGVTHTKANPTRSAMLQTPIFNRATEAAAPLQTLESALRLSPSIDVRERGGKGVQTDLSIRGGSFDQTMVMLNGINFTDARTGHQTHALPIDIESVAGIELIDGVAGVGAYAGAINIRTAPLKANYLRAEISTGDYGYTYNALSGGVTSGKFNVFGAASYRKSDGYAYNTGFENINAYTRATYDSSKAGFFDLQAGFQRREFGANAFYSLSNPDQYETTHTALASLRWVKDWGERVTLNSSVSYRKNFDNYEWIRYSDVGENFHNTDNVWSEIYADYRSSWGVTTLGGDYTFNHIWSTNLGEEQSEANGKYTHQAERHIGNFYLRHTKNWSQFGVSAYAGVSTTPYGAYPIWSVSGSYSPIKSLRLEVGANESMRLPTFTDLYYTSAINIPNASLQPESATTYQFTAAYSREQWNVMAKTYYRDGRNIIDWTQDSDDTEAGVWRSRQFTSLGTFGTEISGGYTFNKFVRRISASYGYVTQNKDSGGYISKYAFEYMHNKGVLSVDFALARNLSLVLTASVYDRCGNYTDAAGEVQDYNPYFLLDGRIRWERKGIAIYVDAMNITSTEYYDYGGLQMPPIWASGGISVTL